MKKVRNNNKNILLKLFSLLIISCILNLDENISASPAVNMYNSPIILYDVKGINPFSSPTNDCKMSIDILPYYQNANSSKNGKGDKVPTGDRLGKWSMLGLLEGTLASPGVAANGDLDATAFPELREAQDQIGGQLKGHGIILQDNTFTGSNILGNYSIPIKYEQIGLRTCMKLNFAHGVGLKVRGGFGSYKQSAKFIDLTTTMTFFDSMLTNTVETLLMAKGKRKAITKEIGFNMNNTESTGLEDIHVELNWSSEFAMKLEDSDPIVNVIPSLAVGIWIPTGRKKNQDSAFSLPLGNEVYGITAEGEINIKFPQIIQLGFGGTITFWGNRTENFRIPTARGQSNIYPWKIKAKRQYGPSWNIHADLCAEDFIDRLSFYLNFIYAKNEKSHFDLKGTPEQNSLFLKGAIENETFWESKKFYFGFDYRITKNLALGIGVLAPITERKAYRTVTVFGTLRFSWF